MGTVLRSSHQERQRGTRKGRTGQRGGRCTSETGESDKTRAADVLTRAHVSSATHAARRESLRAREHQGTVVRSCHEDTVETLRAAVCAPQAP